MESEVLSPTASNFDERAWCKRKGLMTVDL